MGAKSSHSIIRLTLKVQSPGVFSAGNSPKASLNGNVIRAYNGLSIENEEGIGIIRFPLIQVTFNVILDTRQATQGG